MVRRAILCAFVAVLGLTAAALAGEILESVEKKIVQQADKCKSAKIAMHITADASSGDTIMTTVSDVRSEFVRKSDARTPWRMESKIKRVTKVAKQRDQVEEGTSLIVCDGQCVYTLTQVEDQKTATKARANRQDANTFDARSDFEEMKKLFSLKLLSDAAVDGRDCYVIEAVRNKPGAGEAFARVVTYYDKKSGLPAKSICYDSSGKTVQTTVVTDLKTNVDIPDERFVFKAPAGVPVLDMTRINNPATQPDDAAIMPELPDE